MAWSVFVRLTVHLASFVSKYSPRQVRGEWRKHHSVGTQILISNRPSSAATVEGSPLSALLSCSVWACFLSQDADLRGQPCLSLLFMTGAHGLRRLRSTVIHRAHNFHREKLRYIYIYIPWPANQGLPHSNQTGPIPLLPVAFMTHPCLRWQSFSLSTKR